MPRRRSPSCRCSSCWLGIGFSSKVALVFLGSFIIVLINTETGVAHVDPRLIETARSFTARERQILAKIVLPSALPFIIAGMRLAIGRALVMVRVAEIYASNKGLGYLIFQAGGMYDTAQVFVGVGSWPPPASASTRRCARSSAGSRPGGRTRPHDRRSRASPIVIGGATQRRAVGLRDVSLDIAPGTFVCFLGTKRGCGQDHAPAHRQRADCALAWSGRHRRQTGGGAIADRAMVFQEFQPAAVAHRAPQCRDAARGARVQRAAANRDLGQGLGSGGSRQVRAVLTRISCRLHEQRGSGLSGGALVLVGRDLLASLDALAYRCRPTADAGGTAELGETHLIQALARSRFAAAR